MASLGVGDGTSGDKNNEDFEVLGLGKFDLFGFGRVDCFGTYWRLDYKGIQAVISWCMWQGLISKKYVCPSCKNVMKLVQRKDCIDGYIWVCRVHQPLTKHYIKRSIRSGSWFEASKLPLYKILLITAMWNSGVPFKLIARQTEVDLGTLTVWGSFCKEVVFDILMKDNCKIGGKGKVVEINVSKFEKYNCSKTKLQGTWVFSGIEKETDKCFFKLVDKRSKEVLLKILEEHVLPGTRVFSDCWEGYGGVQDRCFQHFMSKHKVIFKDLNSESHAPKDTRRKRSKQDTHEETSHFDFHLTEYIWRRLHKNDELRMKNLLEGIQNLYPPRSEDPMQNLYPPRSEDPGEAANDDDLDKTTSDNTRKQKGADVAE